MSAGPDRNAAGRRTTDGSGAPGSPSIRQLYDDALARAATHHRLPLQRYLAELVEARGPGHRRDGGPGGRRRASGGLQGAGERGTGRSRSRSPLAGARRTGTGRRG